MTAMQNHTRDNSRRTALLYARLIDPGTGLDETGGLLVEDGRIVDLGPDVAADTVGDAQIIDCGGHVLAPGLIDTPLIRRSMVTDEIRARAVEGAPVRRIGVPEDIAAACAFLVSEEAGFYTGQVMSPNGGRYM